MPCQDIFDGIRCYDVAEINERTLDSVVTPGGILPRHAEYQIGYLLRNARLAGSLLGIRLLLRDELPIPGKQYIGCHQRLQLTKCPAPKHLGLHGQSHHPLFVGKPEPLSFELLLENTVLCDEIIDDHLLLSVRPAGQGDNQ